MVEMSLLAFSNCAILVPIILSISMIFIVQFDDVTIYYVTWYENKCLIYENLQK